MQSSQHDSKLDRATRVAALTQSVLLSIGVVVGGVWALVKFSALLEPQIATAEVRRKEAEADIAIRQARDTRILSAELAASASSPLQSGGPRVVRVELSLKNLGNQPLRVLLDEESRFYIAKIAGVSTDGVIEYSTARRLRFDYPDFTPQWVEVLPSTEPVYLRTVQVVNEPGLYLVRFSSPAGADGTMYNLQTYLSVK